MNQPNLRDQIPLKVRLRWLSYFTKCLSENLENTTENETLLIWISEIPLIISYKYTTDYN